MRSEMQPLLEIREVTKTFGGLVALHRVSMTISKGEIFALIGPNGSGKTTLVNVISGVYKADSGSILFNGREIENLKPHEITRSGLCRTFQNIRLFPSLTVLDNVITGSFCKTKSDVLKTLFGFGKRSDSAINALEVLKYLGISEKREDNPLSLPYGDQKRVEVARALNSDPVMLLLDEPTAGMNPNEKKKIGDLILSLRDSGKTILLIDHDMGLVMGVADRISVLNFGRKIAEGNSHEIKNSGEVITAYLGEE